MDGKWRLVIEGEGGFCRGGVQMEYDAEVIGAECVAKLVAQKQNLTSAQFSAVPPQDAFARDLLNGPDALRAVVVP